MKKILFVLLSLIMCAPIAFGATSIKRKGMDQATLVQAIYVLQQALNATISHSGEIDNWIAYYQNSGIMQPNGALLGNPALEVGTDTLSLKIANAFDYTVNSVYYTKAVTDNACDFSTQADLEEATGRFNIYSVSIDPAGVCHVDAGLPQATAEDNEAQAWPVPAGEIVIGNFRIGAVGSDHSFTLEVLDADGLESLPPVTNDNNAVLLSGFAQGAVGNNTEEDPTADVSLDA